MLKTYRGKWKLGHSGFPHRLFARNQGSGVVRGTSVCILGGGPVGLLLSSQLSSYGIKHCIVERRLTPTQHPQAHFMNARTMEILQAHLPIAFKSVLQEMPSSDNWRYFMSCCSYQRFRDELIRLIKKHNLLTGTSCIVTLSLGDNSPELITSRKRVLYSGI